MCIRPESPCSSTGFLAHACFFAVLLASAGFEVSTAAGRENGSLQEDRQAEAEESAVNVSTNTIAESRTGYLVEVDLPITGAIQEKVEQAIRRLAENAPDVDEADDRIVVVLEFDTSNSKNGRGSRFGSCLDLARFLTSPELSNVETIAYIPEPKGYVDESDTTIQPKSEVVGHAVLVALACNHLIMHQDSSIGRAGIDESSIDDGLRNTYRQIAAKRLTLDIDVALSMIDPDRAVFRVDLGEGKIDYVERKTLDEMQTAGSVVQFETLSEKGNLPLYSSKLLSKIQLLRHRVNSRGDIATRFRLNPNALEGDPTQGKPPNPIQLDLVGSIDQRNVSWVINSLRTIHSDVNLLIVKIDSEGGDISQCLRLANELAQFDSNSVRTIAFVPKHADQGAALIALACDHLVMAPGSTIGGPPELEPDQNIDPEIAQQLMIPVKELSPKINRDWSLLMAMIDPDTKLKIWGKSGRTRLLSDEEFESLDELEKQEWNPLRELDTIDGLDADQARSHSIARYVVDDIEQLKTHYHIKGDVQVLEQTMADRWVESLARRLAAPGAAGMLMFLGMVFLWTELSQPGIGFPGFLGTLCFLLFFWSQWLDGNVNWLEILLFVVGVVFVLLEVFVIPGFGVFGIGGLLMIVTSIVLATQTFVIPNTRAEFDRLPVSLSMVLAAAAGSVVALIFLRKYLPNMPVFHRLLLTPPGQDEHLVDLETRESVVNRKHLLGSFGSSVTPLVPSGKARFGREIVDVISSGQVIEKGQEVVVVEVVGNRVVVEAKS